MYQNASRSVIGLVSRLRPQEKSPWKGLTFKGFGVLLRSGRDSNPRPHAWQACILTSWTTEPFLHQVTAVTLKCGAKIDSFSYYTIFRPWKNGKKCIFITEGNILEGPRIKGYGLFTLRMNGLLIKVIKYRLKFQFTVLEFNFFFIFVAHNNCQI